MTGLEIAAAIAAIVGTLLAFYSPARDLLFFRSGSRRDGKKRPVSETSVTSDTASRGEPNAIVPAVLTATAFETIFHGEPPTTEIPKGDTGVVTEDPIVHTSTLDGYLIPVDGAFDGDALPDASLPDVDGATNWFDGFKQWLANL